MVISKHANGYILSMISIWSLLIPNYTPLHTVTCYDNFHDYIYSWLTTTISTEDIYLRDLLNSEEFVFRKSQWMFPWYYIYGQVCRFKFTTTFYVLVVGKEILYSVSKSLRNHTHEISLRIFFRICNVSFRIWRKPFFHTLIRYLSEDRNPNMFI